MALNTPPPLTPPGPPNDTTPDSGLLGKGGAGGGLPQEIVDNYPLVAQAIQDNEIQLVEAGNNYLDPIEGILGGLAVADKNQEYFAVIFEAGDTSPEIIDQTQFKVTYLCDSVLNVSKPADGTVAVSNITQNFERQKVATVRVDQGTVLNQQLGGNHSITAVGSLEPIAGSQLGKGPYEYSTTMSFLLQDQLEGVPGVPVVNYYNWAAKQGGYQDLPLIASSSGFITVPQGAVPTAIGNFEIDSVIEANSGTPARIHFDGLGTENTGSGSEVGADLNNDINPTTAQINDLGYDTTNYFNNVTLLTSSLDGITRVRARVGASLTIVTSSVLDLFMSLNAYDGSPPTPFFLKIYKSGSDGEELVGETEGSLSTRNLSLLGVNGPGPATTTGTTAFNIDQFHQGNLNQIQSQANIFNNNFDWAPIVSYETSNESVNYSSAQVTITTDFFDFKENDKIYAEISLGQEQTSSAQLYYTYESNNTTNNVNALGGYTASLEQWKNTAPYRTYKYKWGSMVIEQEVPQGIEFIQGQTGVTASYGYIGDNGEVTSSYYNYTSSYWVGYNNIQNESSSFSYITASSDLTTFYGGQYTQVNPGVEDYNLYNANGEAFTPLYPNNNPDNIKTTWNSFGFNPIRLPFVPIIGDFIRFEYSKSKVFQIIGISSLGGNLQLKLNGQIPSSTILDNFVIYRVVEDGQYIILDVKKNLEAGVEQAFSGIITAQYRSENLEKRADTLIYDLKQAGIIEEGAYLSRRGFSK